MAMHNRLQLHAILIFVCLAYHASSYEQEDYWKMKLPTVSMPQAIKDNLLHSHVPPPLAKEKANSNKPYNYLWDWSYNADNANAVHRPFAMDAKERKASTNKPYNYLWDWSYNADYANAVHGPFAIDTKERKASSNKLPYNYLWDWSYDADNANAVHGSFAMDAKERKATTNKPHNYLWDWSYNAIHGQFAIDTEGKTNSNKRSYNYLWDWSYDADKANAIYEPFVIDSKGKKAKEPRTHRQSLHYHFMHDNVNSNNAHQHEADSNSGSLFFMEKSLRLGKKLKHDFQKTPVLPFLPKHVVQSIPFSVDQFAEILALFSLKSESAEATTIKDALDVCFNRPKVKLENRTCAQSMEDIVDFVVGELGTNEVELKMMNNNIEVPNGRQDYVITKVKKFDVPSNTTVACHRVSYPYVVYYCHHQKDIGQYDVTLVSPASGSVIQTTAICHYDTYAWAPNSPALRDLGIHPGDASVCHFSAISDMYWTLKANSKSLDMAQ